MSDRRTPFDDQRNAERLVSTGITGILRLADAYRAQIEAHWANDPQMREYAFERLQWKLDDVDVALAHARRWIATERAAGLVRDRIAKLRNTEGRTPEEAQAFRAKADQLERALGRAQAATHRSNQHY